MQSSPGPPAGQRVPFIKLRVYYKIILPFLLVIILGNLTTIPFGIRIINRLNIEKADKELVSVAQIVQNEIDNRLDDVLAYSQVTIQNPVVKEAISRGDATTLVRFLLPLKVRLRLSLVAAYDGNQKRIVGLGPEDVLDELTGLGTVAGGLMGINMKSVEVTDRQIILLAAVPNESSERGIEGALVAGFLLDKAMIEYLSVLINHRMAVLTVDNRLIVAGDPVLAEKARAALARVEGPQIEKPFYIDYTSEGAPWRAVARDLTVYNVPKARIAVATPMYEIFDARNKIIGFIVLMSLLGTAGLIVMGIFVARTINNPLRRLLSLTGEVGRGNLDVRVENITHDELGELSVAFNRMIDGLRENLAEIHSSRSKIARYAHELERFSLQLQRDKKEIEAILVNMRDGLMMVAPRGTIMAINPEAARIIGRDPASCQGTSAADAIEPFSNRVADPDALLRSIIPERGGGEEESIEVLVQKPHRTIYRLKRYPVYDESRNLLGWVILWTNITREKEIEEMKNNFLATISHELRTPLTSIKGSLNLLMDGNLGPVTNDRPRQQPSRSGPDGIGGAPHEEGRLRLDPSRREGPG
jgi:signal transduction histidine kinase